MFKLLLSLLFTFSLFANEEKEEILTCHITEPFITYTFSPKTKTVTKSYYVEDYVEEVVSTSAKFVSLGTDDEDGMVGSKYIVLDTNTGTVYANLTLSNNGSDGMSDRTYPFEAKVGSYYAGCESTSAPAVDLFNSVYNLKNQM